MTEQGENAHSNMLVPNRAKKEQTRKKYCVISPDLEFSPKVSPNGVRLSLRARAFCAGCESSLWKNSKIYDLSEVRGKVPCRL